MAQCHDLFLTFNDNIKLKPLKKEDLRRSRNAIRGKIRDYFKNTLKVNQPKFWGQGSYMMNTTIAPIEGEFDIDDGVYLEHLSKEKEENWPSVQTVHNWILKAVDGHTNTPPSNKNTCVRVIYKNDYHVDLPIYIKSVNNDHPKLAHLSKGWMDSDPKELTNWFNNEVSVKGEQLKRIVRYLKAWKDFKKGSNRFASGMVLTILAANHYVSGYDDDSALIATAQSIYDELSYYFSLKRSVFPYEELLGDWSDISRLNFLTKLSNLINDGQRAIEEESKTESAKNWAKIFGDRFPEYTPPENSTSKRVAQRTSQPAVLGNYGRSS